jgi:hypothetical protein
MVDPSGHRTCTPEQATGDETCTNIHDEDALYDDDNLYSYSTRPVRHGGDVLYFISVDYSEGAWGFYTTASGYEAGTVLIPVRSTDLEWQGSYAATYAGLETWEVGARNIVAEMSGAIQEAKPFATADAIAIAYSPYNRSNSEVAGWSGKDVKELLIAGESGNQYAGSSYPDGHQNYLAVEPVNYRGSETFEFALITAYGVDQGYLWDTSFGSHSMYVILANLRLHFK